ncbi:MAG: zf-HC2 domain-containing protein [Caulobacter sp.]|nr:zf-HC2 domain-containing protein [Caulobacter sp.]
MTVTDEMLMAYVDGELDADTAAAVEAAAAADAALAGRLAGQRLLAGAVAGAFADIAQEPVPDRLIDAVRAGRADTVVSLDAARQRRAPPAWGWISGIAAGVVGGLVIGLTLPHGGDPLVGGDMRARGALASALDAQLASAPPKGALVQVGLTFRSKDNRYCRTFTVTRGEGPAGLACRDGDTWIVRMAVPRAGGRAAGDYRTAAAETPPAVIAAVEDMITGESLDARAEAAAKAEGWRR